MKKLLMAVVTGAVLTGTAVTMKAVSLIKSENESIKQKDNKDLVLKHANEIFGAEKFVLTQHSSHSSHSSHGSHGSHSSHSSHYSG